MASGRQSVGIIALLGVIAVGVVAALFGILRWSPLEGGATSQPGAKPPQTVTDLPAPQTGGQAGAPAPAATPPQGAAMAPAPAAPAPAAKPAASSATASPPAAAAAPAAGEPIVPSFDVVRVEPNGESVIAGRSAPGATIEMLRDGQVHARTPADLSGLFALVPPALPPGAHEIVLQSIAPDGTRRRSKETVTIVINDDRSSKPLVALLTPDKPTVVLSSPDQQEQRTAAAPAPTAPAPAAAPAPGAVPAPASPQAPAAAAGPPAARPEARIVTVEAEDGGRLFVSGKASPGATVRLYLNESFVGSGGVDRDGQVAFHIGRGVRPGDYRVRIDDVDPVSGSVKSRAEVAFNVPAPPTGAAAAVAAAQPPTAPGAAAAPAATPDRTAPRQAAAGPDAAPPAGGTPVAPPTSAGGPAAGPAPVVGAAPAAGRAGPPAQVAAAAPSSRELPTGTVVIPDIATAIVAKGDNLWRISHRVYGKGTRYTVIYSANQTQIRNPHRIYPGQVFVLPGDQQAKSN